MWGPETPRAWTPRPAVPVTRGAAVWSMTGTASATTPGSRPTRPWPRSLDGDYYQSQWDKTGVVEADCFICHLPNYDFNERTRQLKMLNYKWAAVAASGIGQVQGFVRDGQQPQGDLQSAAVQ
jgi:hypothetical protein